MKKLIEMRRLCRSPFVAREMIVFDGAGNKHLSARLRLRRCGRCLRHNHVGQKLVREFGQGERAGVKTVVLTHLPATADPKDEYKRFAEQVKKHFSRQVVVAKDLMEF